MISKFDNYVDDFFSVYTKHLNMNNILKITMLFSQVRAELIRIVNEENINTKGD